MDVDLLDTAAPRYIQIAERLLERIESGELIPGDQLPSERDLSDTLNVSRMTLRAALRILEQQGLLVRQQGAGTYIAQPKIERQAGKLISFTRNMQRRGYKTGAKVILFEQRPAKASIAKKLHIPTATPVHYFQRLRLINREPLLLEKFTIPVARFPGLDKHDLVNRSIYEIMEMEYSISVSHAQQSLEPVVATEYEAALLTVEPGAPLMLERRVTFDQQGRPIEWGEDLYRGDRFRFITEIAPLEV